MTDGANSESVVLARVSALRIGSVQVDPARCLLRDDAGRDEAIEPRVMQVLVALARADGAPVSRDELIASCWAGRVVSNDAVTRIISILRKLAVNDRTQAVVYAMRRGWIKVVQTGSAG